MNNREVEQLLLRQRDSEFIKPCSIDSKAKLTHQQNSEYGDSLRRLTPFDPRPQVETSLRKLDAWIEAQGFQGWDPYDALNSSLLKWWGNRPRVLGIALTQLLRRCPVNLRPLLRVPKGYNPKGMGLFLATYTQKFQATRNQADLDLACFFHDWLIDNVSPEYAGACWGYNFDWANRAVFVPAGTPTIVNTAFIGLAFLAAHLILNGRLHPLQVSMTRKLSQAETKKVRTRHTDALTLARSACEFILRDLHVFRPAADELCFSYTPIDRRCVHNANLLGALLLAAVSSRNRESRLAETALAAARFTARRQQGNGSWPYGIARSDSWVDNFHTGYVLVALKQIALYLDTKEFDNIIGLGYQFWKTHMLSDGLLPKNSPASLYPIDIHSVAQAILTCLVFSDIDSNSISLAWHLAQWASEHMQDERGFFFYQKHRTFQIRTPYMRWSQAWMQRALVSLLNNSLKQ